MRHRESAGPNQTMFLSHLVPETKPQARLCETNISNKMKRVRIIIKILIIVIKDMHALCHVI